MNTDEQSKSQDKSV
ncbi:unnamed protein product [Acanthoscelides obtectus]|uniref:Uncharacterized protein n=1 Tax=Acanthoscelides obtectus TaxID=200917 RepID=A0A9P0KK16_ACAOB|nr:unnamed protein product [Acanthoscelides obtectus]CAK1635722.1 hypothetical protein AOBTE_LOCUS9463 [Acanthoscelides obtectus]